MTYEQLLKVQLLTKLLETQAIALELAQNSDDCYTRDRARLIVWIEELRSEINAT